MKNNTVSVLLVAVQKRFSCTYFYNLISIYENEIICQDLQLPKTNDKQ